MMVLTRPVQSKPLQQYATAVRYISTLQQYTTAVHRWVRILARIREVRIATIMLSFQFDLQESIYW